MIIFLGLAGSGKSTQGQILAKKYGWQWISAGDLIRRDGRFDETVQSGNLVGHEELSALMSEAFDKAEAAGQTVVLDGYPRDLEQTNWLLDNYADQIAVVIYVEVQKEELLNRIAKRGRADDTEDALKRRFEIAEQNNCSILSLLKSKNIRVETVDGAGPIELITKRVEEVLNG